MKIVSYNVNSSIMPVLSHIQMLYLWHYLISCYIGLIYSAGKCDSGRLPAMIAIATPCRLQKVQQLVFKPALQCPVIDVQNGAGSFLIPAALVQDHAGV